MNSSKLLYKFFKMISQLLSLLAENLLHVAAGGTLHYYYYDYCVAELLLCLPRKWQSLRLRLWLRHCKCSGSGSGNASRSDGTFHNLLHFMVVRWQTAQKSAAKIQMNSKLLKRQPDRRRGRTARLWHCQHDAAGSETAAETAVSVTTTFDLKRAVRTRSEKLL